VTVVARTALLVLVVAASLAFAGTASAKTTKGFSFTSHNKAINHSATNGSDDPTTYEDFPFTIAPSEKDGTINVNVHWSNPADDFDLYLYRKGAGGTLQTIGQSAGAPPSDAENAIADSQGVPMKPGSYVVRVVNYLATVPSFDGTVRFGEFVPANQIPIAKLSAPRNAHRGQQIKLDASNSRDPDGTIKSYAFDLDGNGAMEVDNGKNPVLKRALSPGTHHVAVRVIDNGGLRAFANATVTVSK
jgi:hypothetical protein